MVEIRMRKGPVYDLLTGEEMYGTYEPSERIVELVGSTPMPDEVLKHELTHAILKHVPQEEGWLSQRGMEQELERAIFIYRRSGDREELEDSLDSILEAYAKSQALGKDLGSWKSLVSTAISNIDKKYGRT